MLGELGLLPRGVEPRTYGDVVVPISQSMQLTFFHLDELITHIVSILFALYSSSSIDQPSKIVR
jgi:hypothetical protein